jgi:hypothetical protein
MTIVNARIAFLLIAFFVIASATWLWEHLC